MEILGIFRDIESAGSGVEELVKAGFVAGQITSLTSVAYPDGVLVKAERNSWFRWLTLAGGIAGAGAGFLLAAGTAWLYPVQTGDKPIIALYPTGIIVFEIIMLFAIIGTMAGMFLEMRLPPRKTRPYDPAIAEGCIGISVAIHAGGDVVECGAGIQEECIGITASLSAEEQRSLVEELMREAGAMRVIVEESI
jgi:hypothetical protein